MSSSSASTSSEEFEFEGSPSHQATEDVSTTVPEYFPESLKSSSCGDDIPDQSSSPSETLTNAASAEANISSNTHTDPATEDRECTNSPPKSQSKLKSKAVKSKVSKKLIANTKPKKSAKAKKPSPKPSPKPPKKAKGGSKKVPIKGKTVAKGKPISSRQDLKSEPPAALDLFTRHYREFERCFARLEKVDLFGFFWDTAPEEFNEDYTTTTAKATEKKSKDAATCEGSLGINTEASPTDAYRSSTTFPNHAPFNWEMIRRRRDQGRYILDIREREEERSRLLAEYLKKENRGVGTTVAGPTPVLHGKGVNWDLFRDDVIAMCNSTAERNSADLGDGKAGSLSYAVKKVLGAMDQIYERTGWRQIQEITLANDRHKFGKEMDSTTNNEPAFQGKWRQKPFPERKYERLIHKNVVCDGLSELDERIACFEQRTSLPDSFVGVSYKYEDDTGKSEGWMKSVLWETGGRIKAEEAALALAEDDGVIRAQVTACMEMLLVAVQDKCLTEADVLHQPELRSANWEEGSGKAVRIEEPNKESMQGSASTPDIVEQPVWGIDCYTRRNVQIALKTEFDEETTLVFIEKWLLPAINACPVDLACNIANAALILEGLPLASSKDNDTGEGGSSITATEERWSHSLIGKSLKNKIQTHGPPWLKLAAQLLRRAREAMGPDFFRVHPKGHGSIVISPSLEPNTLVTFYRGEVYPSWRWGEKMDAIDITQARKKLKPALPDFYNMALERPQKDPRKYGLLFVDASRKAGHGSSVSHSCAPTCEVRVAAVGGELCLAMTTLRRIEMGEELTFDYNAVTESLVEYRSAVCLCGYGKCRGSFLHFATADCYQEVLKRNAPIAVRFASLVKGSMKEVMSPEDDRTLRNHGFMTAAFGAIAVNRHKAPAGQANDEMLLDSMENVPIWLRTFVADTLRYIEYERRALPISLICEDLSKPKGDAACSSHETKRTGAATTDSRRSGGKNAVDENDNEKPAKASKPMPTFFFYCRANDAHFRTVLKNEEGLEEKDLPGLDFNRAIKRVAGAQWKLLSAEDKANWKKKAEKDWEKQHGQMEAAQRKKRREEADTKPKPKAKKARKKRQCLESKFESSNVSFQAADAEGAAAMEQRIQQLAQSLSRVGRVLDRHRESLHVAGPEESPESLRRQVHAPLTVATDEQVVAWLWNGQGLVPTMLERIESEEVVSPSLKAACLDIKKKHDVLDGFGCHRSIPEDFPIRPSKARKKLASALLEFRKAILKDLRAMARDLKKEKLREKAERKRRQQEARAAKLASTNLTASDAQSPEGASRVVLSKIQETSHNSNERKSPPQHLHNQRFVEDQQATDCVLSLVRPNELRITGAEGSADGSAFEKSSMATPSLHMEDKNDAETPALISREVSSEMENEAVDSVPNVGAAPTADLRVTFERSPTPASSREEEPAKECLLAATVNGKNGDAFSKKSNLSFGLNSDMDEPKQDADSANERNQISGDIAAVGEVALAAEVSSVMQYLVDTVVALAEKNESAGGCAKKVKGKKSLEEDDDKPKPWLKHYDQRHKLQSAADLLLLYAKTSTFFLMQPYKPLKSTPIEVYAREIGNAVPRSVIDKSVANKNTPPEEHVAGEQNGREQIDNARNPNEANPMPAANNKSSKKGVRHGKTDTLDEELCEPDDVVAEVTVKYQGDYVLSQLLQWYNAGIGQNPGLPETIGCLRLPPMSGCWGQNGRSEPDTETPTDYESKTRPAMVNWFSDPHQRGSPWPTEVKDAFSFNGSADLPSDTSSLWLPLGSPVLDLLVTGDDSNILSILDEFGADESQKRESGLLSTVDEGRPAQAVSNWIQCEACGKWRRMAWYVDIDVLAEGFVCSDNKWNKKSASCDAPEDDYAEAENDVVDYTSPMKPEAKFEAKKDAAGRPVKELFQPVEKGEGAVDATTKQVDENLLVVGGRFDVLRKGKSKFCVGIVREVITENGSKKVKFHFPKLQSKHDEYVEMGRIAPLYSRVKPPEKRRMSGPKPESKRPRLDDIESERVLPLDMASHQSQQTRADIVSVSSVRQPGKVDAAGDSKNTCLQAKGDFGIGDSAWRLSQVSSREPATSDGVQSSAPEESGATLVRLVEPATSMVKPERCLSVGEAKEGKKKAKEKKRKRRAPPDTSAKFGDAQALAGSTEMSIASPPLTSQVPDTNTQRNKPENTNVNAGQDTQRAPCSSQTQQPARFNHPDDIEWQLRVAAAAAGFGNEAIGALAGLYSLRIPRKVRAATEPSIARGTGGLETPDDSVQLAREPCTITPCPRSNERISYGQYVQQSISNQPSLYKRPQQPTASSLHQQLVARDVSQYQGTVDKQIRLQHIQVGQNAANFEIQRQRIQHQMQTARYAEIHRPLLQPYAVMERANPLMQGGASTPSSQLHQLQHEDCPDYAPDYRYGYQHGDNPNGQRRI